MIPPAGIGPTKTVIKLPQLAINLARGATGSWSFSKYG